MPIVDEMEYRFVQGFREGSQLLYSESEKLLYRQKCKKDDGVRVFICYQSILAKQKKNKKGKHHCDCSARIQLLSNGVCKQFEHSKHEHHDDHEKIVRDMEKVNKMKENCKLLKNNHNEDAHKVSARNIFQREIIK